MLNVVLQKWLIALGILIASISLAGFAGRFGWIFELVSHFRVQYFVSLILIAFLLTVLGRGYIAAGFALCAALNLLTILPLYYGTITPASAAAPGLRVLSLNVNSQNQAYARVKGLIADYQPDIVVLQEITPRWWAELQTLKASYPHSIAASRDGVFGIGLFSKSPLHAAKIVYLGTTESPLAIAKVRVGGKSVTLFGAHPPPPDSPSRARLRNEQLAEIARLLRNNTKPVLLVGDLNTTPWSYYFAELLNNSGLKNCSCGRGVMPTWPSGFPLLWIPIDHCLFSEGIVIQNKQIGPAVGSDHYPVIIDIVVAL